MPHRHRSHQLEDASRLALASRLPVAWVLRSESPDYGIDGSIEIFSEGGSPTGLRCLVQLKATGGDAPRQSIRLKRETADYYRSLETPVLLVLYQSVPDIMYVRWFHEFDPYYGGVGKKWITFRFRDGDQWTVKSPVRLEKDLATFRTLRNSQAVPTPIPFDVIVEDDKVGGFARIRLRSAVTRRLGSIRSVFSRDGEPVVWIRINDQETVVSLRGRHSATLHTHGAAFSLDSFCEDVLVLCAMTLGIVGDHSLASSIAADAASKSSLLSRPDVFMRIARSMVASQQGGRALELGRKVLSEEDQPALDILLAMMTLGRCRGNADPRDLEAHLRDQINRTASEGTAILAGVAHYNLANHLRAEGRYKEAIHHFRAAVVNHPGYGARDYVCRELASCLFAAGRYAKASQFYARALDRGGPPAWRALYADALMFAGRYRDARETFREYLESGEAPAHEWVVKHWAVSMIIERGLAEGRASRASQAVLDGIKSDGAPDAELVTDAIKLDPLSVSAWLGLAAAKSSDVSHSTRCEALLIAASIARNDPLLWAQAFVHAKGSGNVWEGAPSIAFAAMEVVGYRFAEAVHECCTAVDLPIDLDEQMAEGLQALEEAFDAQRKPGHQELRFSGIGSDYHSITISDQGVEGLETLEQWLESNEAPDNDHA